MFLEIDMGNTRLKWRVRDQQTTMAYGAIGIEEPLDLLGDTIQLYRNDISFVAVASVVGEILEKSLRGWILAYLGIEPNFARTGVQCGAVRNGYSEPEKLGVDRWLCMVAAYRLTGKACIVVSCGTAITLDLVARDGKHIGGFIAPGLNLMLDSLNTKTRQIKLSQPISELSLLPATSTVGAISSACAAMLNGLVNNGVQQLTELGQGPRSRMIFTGGDAAKLLPFYPQARLVPDLVLDGLAFSFDYPQ